MEDNTIQGISRMIESLDYRFYKIEGQGRWYLLDFGESKVRKNYLSGVVVLSGSDLEFYDDPDPCYLINYEAFDPDLEIILKGKVPGVSFFGRVITIPGEILFNHCRQIVCTNCTKMIPLTMVPVEGKDFPLYIKNNSPEFDRILKNEEFGFEEVKERVREANYLENYGQDDDPD